MRFLCVRTQDGFGAPADVRRPMSWQKILSLIEARPGDFVTVRRIALLQCMEHTDVLGTRPMDCDSVTHQRQRAQPALCYGAWLSSVAVLKTYPQLLNFRMLRGPHCAKRCIVAGIDYALLRYGDLGECNKHW